MKKMFLLSAALFVAATIFCGCSKDDDNNFSTADIVGQWKLVREAGYEIIDDIKETFDDDYRDDDDYIILLFRADGTGKKKNNIGEFYDFTYEVKGNILSQTYDYGEVFEYTIEKLTDKELVLLDVDEGDDYYYEGHSYYERQ